MIDPADREADHGTDNGTGQGADQSGGPPPSEAGAPRLVVGLVASPGPATHLADALLPELSERIGVRLPGTTWDVRFTSDRLVQPPTDLSHLISACRRRMLAEGWHLAVCVTDLPLETARRPVVAHASPTHGVAVLSMPALGAVGVRRRASAAIARMVGTLLGDVDRAGDDGEAAAGEAPGGKRRLRSSVIRRIRELGDRVEMDERGVALVARVITGNLRLLLGMLRANRPWRLAIRLSRALVAALAAGLFALVTDDIWRLADTLGTLRLGLIAVASIVGTVLTIVIGANLWEHGSGPGTREQVVLFNVVTLTTVLIGVLALYGALFVLTLLVALLVVPGGLLAEVLGHRVSLSDEVELAWLASSMATVGEALGAGLETDEAVREAAYTYQPDEQLSPDG